LPLAVGLWSINERLAGNAGVDFPMPSVEPYDHLEIAGRITARRTKRKRDPAKDVAVLISQLMAFRKR